MVDFRIAPKCAENYPELLHPVHGNDEILILNHTFQVKNKIKDTPIVKLPMVKR
jgi:hypothetical protein